MRPDRPATTLWAARGSIFERKTYRIRDPAAAVPAATTRLVRSAVTFAVPPFGPGASIGQHAARAPGAVLNRDWDALEAAVHPAAPQEQVATFTDPAVGKPQGGVVRDHRAPPCSRLRPKIATTAMQPNVAPRTFERAGGFVTSRIVAPTSGSVASFVRTTC